MCYQQPMEAKKYIGKLFMFGFEGTEPTKEILSFIKEDKIGGIILFKRNIQSVEQLKGLIDKLQDASSEKLFIAIDQEGGRVSNLPRSFIDMPPMGDLGKADLIEAEKLANALGIELGHKLLSLGINIDFAPVLDVLTNPGNKVIGNRSFGDKPEIVARLACEQIRGMDSVGLISCGKHFPGHGDTLEDSHELLPRVSHDRNRLNEIELKPFRAAIECGVPTMMSAHVIYENVDPKNPATLSKLILTDILRKELGFDGVVFSDDMEMKAISHNYNFGESTIQAINAGCDILLVCKTPALQRTAIDSVKKAIDNGSISQSRLSESLARIGRLGMMRDK